METVRTVFGLKEWRLCTAAKIWLMANCIFS
jgi:hypothetical protein